MSVRNVLVVMALAGSTLAQSNSCSVAATTTIQNSGDASALASCTTFSGSVAIQTGVTNGIDISGNLQSITGDLVASNAVMLPSLSSSSLASIGGTFGLVNMTLLTSLSFSALTSVGSIAWTTLPRLNALTFNQGVSKASTVGITDTGLGSLSGISLATVNQMTISNNLALNTVDMPLTKIGQSFAVEFNGGNMTVNFPQLQNAFNMTFRNVTTINMQGLSTVNDTLGFYGCDFTSFSLNNLTSTGGTLSFIGNQQVTNISMPSLTSVKGAIQLAQNPQLNIINGFPKVSTVGGAIDINGNFSSVSFPALSNVAGAFNLQSTKDITSTCNYFAPLQGAGKTIKGKLTCNGTLSNPGGVGTTPSGTSSSSTQKGEAGRDLYARSSAITGVLGVMAALFGML